MRREGAKRVGLGAGTAPSKPPAGRQADAGQGGERPAGPDNSAGGEAGARRGAADRRGLAVVAGYALFLAAEFVLLHSPTLLSHVAPTDCPRWAPYRISLLGLQALVLALGAGLALRRRAWRRRVVAPAAAVCVCLALAQALVLTDSAAPATRLGQPLIVAIALFYGAGSGLFFLGWSQVFCAIAPGRLYRQLIGAYLLGLVVYLLAIALPGFALVPCLIAAALVSAALLWLLQDAIRAGAGRPGDGGPLGAEAAGLAPRQAAPPPRTEFTWAAEPTRPRPAATPGGAAPAASSGQASRPGAAPAAPSGQARRRGLGRALDLCWRGLLITASLAFMSGLMSQISGQERLPLRSFQQVSIAASLVVVAILLLSALALKRPLDITAAYRLALPISAGGFLLLPFALNALPGITSALVHMGYMTVSIPFLYLLAVTAAQTRLPAQAVFGGGLAGVAAANLAGVGLGFAAGGPDDQGPLTLAAVALASLYVLSLVSLLLVRRQRPARPGAPQLEAGAESAAGAGPEVGARQVVVADDNRFLANCQSLSTGFGLTPREAEMLPLLGQGRSAAGISKLLYISENTTKSHIRSIYRKLGVHTKQDLIERVRSVRQ